MPHVRGSETDVGTAKNYLNREEIDILNRITVMFLDQAEFRAQRRRNIHMAEWEQALDKFLSEFDLPVLDNAGSVSKEAALEFAHDQYDQFADQRRTGAQRNAEQNYLDDLRKTAATLKRRKRGSDDEN
jgi:hypothetical protein